MKIRKADYDTLENAVRSALLHHSLTAGSITSERQRWHLFSKACRVNKYLSATLYFYLNDDDVDTALRRILKKAAS